MENKYVIFNEVVNSNNIIEIDEDQENTYINKQNKEEKDKITNIEK